MDIIRTGGPDKARKSPLKSTIFTPECSTGLHGRAASRRFGEGTDRPFEGSLGRRPAFPWLARPASWPRWDHRAEGRIDRHASASFAAASACISGLG